MKVLLVVALVACVKASSLPELGAKCNIEEDFWWRSAANHNPNTYLFCDNKIVTLGTCNSGNGFFKTGHTTCTAFATWKCLNFDEDVTCDNNQSDLRALANPNLYYFCDSGNINVASCAADHGFTTSRKVSGCMPWSVWNDQTNCFES